MKRRSKYGATKAIVDGIKFDSKAEANYYVDLLVLKRGGVVTDIELQPRFELQPSFRKQGKAIRKMEYVADFRVTYADGQVEIIDCKGMKTEAYKIKKKLFEYRYPDLTIKEVSA